MLQLLTPRQKLAKHYEKFSEIMVKELDFIDRSHQLQWHLDNIQKTAKENKLEGTIALDRLVSMIVNEIGYCVFIAEEGTGEEYIEHDYAAITYDEEKGAYGLQKKYKQSKMDIPLSPTTIQFTTFALNNNEFDTNAKI